MLRNEKGKKGLPGMSVVKSEIENAKLAAAELLACKDKVPYRL